VLLLKTTADVAGKALGGRKTSGWTFCGIAREDLLGRVGRKPFRSSFDAVEHLPFHDE
jgi:hypothetical protein